MTVEIPETIGRYQIKKKVGQGAMGVVYLGYDEMIDRKVAVKYLRLEKIKNDSERSKIVDLFFKEAKIIGKLNHNHITSIYDIGIHDDYPFLVMEFVSGRTIKEYIAKKVPIPIDSLLRLLAMTARGLHYAHLRGILHRDIKPANIMITPTNYPKIMDFGIARIMDSSKLPSSPETGGKEESEKGFVLGTPHYMSPEQIRGKDLDQRSDVFSLGVMAYEWISGKKPFNGKNLQEVITSIIKQEPEPLDKISNIDKRISDLIHRAMGKKPEHRYQNAEAFSDTIELVLTAIEKKASEEAENLSATGTFSYDQLRVVHELKKNYIFFADFTEDELFTIFSMSNKEKFEKGEVIIQEGTSGAKMYVILKGAVIITKIVDGKNVEVKRLKAGECFGEMTIVDKMPRSATVAAMESTLLIAINEIVLRTSKPELCLKLYKSLAAMISEKLRARDTEYAEMISSKPAR
ncbi:MAG: serine/threonine-protein kinase [Nitrospinota bacterium]|nr:serine/threonine-protein kinase [Nitrospinota bacterium]